MATSCGQGGSGKEFKFVEVDQSTAPKEPMKAVVPKSLFRPLVRESDDRFRDLPGHGSPKWSAPPPLQAMQIEGEEWLLKHCEEHDQWHLSDAAWQVSLLSPGTLVQYQSSLWFVVARTHCLAALWPAEKLRQDTTIFYSFVIAW